MNEVEHERGSRLRRDGLTLRSMLAWFWLRKLAARVIAPGATSRRPVSTGSTSQGPSSIGPSSIRQARSHQPGERQPRSRSTHTCERRPGRPHECPPCRCRPQRSRLHRGQARRSQLEWGQACRDATRQGQLRRTDDMARGVRPRRVRSNVHFHRVTRYTFLFALSASEKRSSPSRWLNLTWHPSLLRLGGRQRWAAVVRQLSRAQRPAGLAGDPLAEERPRAQLAELVAHHPVVHLADEVGVGAI